MTITCFHNVSGAAPPYLSGLLYLFSPSRSLRSTSDTRIRHIPRVYRKTLAERSFRYIGPAIWNALPLSVRHAYSLSCFKSKLEIHLFTLAYWFVIFLLFSTEKKKKKSETELTASALKKRSKTHKSLRERFLIGRNKTKRALFRGSPLFKATYNIKIKNKKTEEKKKAIKSAYLMSVRCSEAGGRKGVREWLST